MHNTYTHGIHLTAMLAILLFAVLANIGCGDQPLFDEMAESRLKVVIKGTFESNAPGSGTWVGLPTDDSINDITPSIAAPTVLMLDFAEMRIASASGGSEDRFANYRQTYSVPLNDSNAFFDGTGVEFRCDDVKIDKTYGRVKLYIRKMIFNNAEQYYLSDSGVWSSGTPAETIFREEDVYGLDFNQLMVNAYYDSLKENADDINRVFPLSIPIDGGFVYGENDGEVVLEIRLVFKDFIKQYEYDYYDEDGRHAVYHFWGLSDWLRDVQADERAIGGNLHAVARVYNPDDVGIISGTTVGSGWVIAIPSENDLGLPQSLDDYFIPAGDRTRPAIDPPSSPYLPAANSIESYLDYYLQYEKYKVDYNTFVTAVDDGSYATDWNNYNVNVGEFRLPPLVTWSNGGAYTLTNVPRGVTYNLYFVASGNVGYGELPEEAGDYSASGSNPVSVGDTVNFP